MHILFGIPVLCYCRDWFILSVMLECFALQSCTENWKNSSIEKLEVRGSSFKCFIRKVTRGDHSVTVGVLQTYVCRSEIGSKTIGMDDNGSDDKQIMVGDSEWTFTIGYSERDVDWGQWTCGCDEWDWWRGSVERDQVVTLPLLVPPIPFESRRRLVVMLVPSRGFGSQRTLVMKLIFRPKGLRIRGWG